jgi:undecaprenyl-diphosphatase
MEMHPQHARRTDPWEDEHVQSVGPTARAEQRRQPRLLLPASAAFFLGYIALATQEVFLALDHGTRGWATSLRSDTLAVPVQVLTSLGEAVGLIPLIAVTFLLTWRSRRRWAVALPGVMAGAGAVQWLAKWLADRPRPDATPMGFPSGHVITLVVLLGVIAYLIGVGCARRTWTASAWLACAVTVASVGFTRLYLDKHWLSDLGGGLAIGLAYLLLTIWLVDVRLPARAARRTTRE